MRSRTADRGTGFHLDMPEMLAMDLVQSGKQLLNIVGPAYAYVFDYDELESKEEINAAKALLADANDFGEIYSMLQPSDHIDAAEQLSERLDEASKAGLLLVGKRITVDATYGDDGPADRWPVAVVRVRRRQDVAAEREAAAEADAALRDGGIEGLEAWAAERAERTRRET